MMIKITFYVKRLNLVTKLTATEAKLFKFLL